MRLSYLGFMITTILSFSVFSSEKGKTPTVRKTASGYGVTEINLKDSKGAHDLCAIMKAMAASSDESIRKLINRNKRRDSVEVYSLNGPSYLTCIGKEFKILIPVDEISSVQTSD